MLVQVGDIVTLSFQRRAPTGVVIERVRKDVDWKDVVLSYQKEIPQAKLLSLNSMHGFPLPSSLLHSLFPLPLFLLLSLYKFEIELSNNAMSFAPKTYGYYVHSQRKQMHKYLATIALKLGLDPLLPASWYSIGPQLQQNKVFISK